jgi:hypothetical protein
MSSHVARETPVGLAVRYAVQMDGATWTANAAVSSVPSPARPKSAPAAAISAAHPVITQAERASASPRRLSMSASRPASSVAAIAGTSALQYLASAKYAIQAALLRLVSRAHAQERPAASSVARSLTICGRNCGIARVVAAMGA